MSKITFEELPPSAQKAYKQTNIIRTITLFITLGITAVLSVIFFKDGGIIGGIGGALVVASLVQGNVHMEFVYRKCIRSWGIIGLLLCVLVFTFTYFLMSAFVIADIVLLIMRKPLIYPFENKCFLQNRAAQAELQWEYDTAVMAAAFNNSAQNSSESAMENIQKLKEMHEQGIITEDEFNSKKAELLGRI